MHLIEHYALSCGAKISKPITPTSYIPVPFVDYIVVSREAEVESKKYDHYQDVLDHISPILEERGIKVIQTGKQGDRPLKGAAHYLGITKKHENYLIQNALLVLSNDFYSSHAASAFNKKLVTLSAHSIKIYQSPFGEAPQTRPL